METKSQKVLVAIDGSSESAEVVRWATQNLSVHNPGDKLVLLHVIKPLMRVITPVGFVGVDLVNPKMVGKLRRVAQEEAETMLAALAEQIQGVDVDCCVVEGDRRKMIVSAVERLGATELVLGSRGGNLLTRLRGSISEHCFKHASCPVYIVRQGKLNRTSAKAATYSPAGATDSPQVASLVEHGRRHSVGDPVALSPRHTGSKSSFRGFDINGRRSFSASNLDLSEPEVADLSLSDEKKASGAHTSTATKARSGPLPETSSAVLEVEASTGGGSASTSSNWGALTPKGPLPEPEGSDLMDGKMAGLSFSLGAESRRSLELSQGGGDDPLVSVSSDEEDLESMDGSFEGEAVAPASDRVLAKPSKLLGQEITASAALHVSSVATLLAKSKPSSSSSFRSLGSRRWGSRKEKPERRKSGEGLTTWPSGPIATAELTRTDSGSSGGSLFEPERLARSTTLASALQGPKSPEIELLKRKLLEAELEVQRARKKAEEEAKRRQKAEEAAGLAWQWAEEEAARRAEASEKSRQAEAAAEEARLKWEEEAARRRAVMVALAAAQPQYRQYEYTELERATNHFAAGNVIGEGGFGRVYKGKLEHLEVAVKVLNREGMQGAVEFESEVAVLGRIRHPHLVTLLGCCSEQGCLVYEYMPGGSLEDRLKRKKKFPPLSWQDRFRIAAEIATAVLALHLSRPEAIVHRDLKPANILLDRHLVSKVADVGMARLVPDLEKSKHSVVADSGPQVGTMAYVDPEYMRTGCFGPKSDVYALGIILLQLLTAKPGMGVAMEVEDAMEGGPDRLKGLLDSTAGDWPWEETFQVFSLALRCAEMRRRDRPDLESEVLPVLDRLRAKAMDAAFDATSPSPRTSFASPRAMVPSSFLCPLTLEPMEDPVVCSDGHTYERKALEEWFKAKVVSPLLGTPLSSKEVQPDPILRANILAWRAALTVSKGGSVELST